MKKARRLLPLIVALFSIACGLIVPVPTPTPLPATATNTASPTSTFTITPDVAATQTIIMALTQISYTATPSPTSTPEINPADLVEEENPLPPPAVSPGASYELKDEVIVGAYGIRFWHNTTDPMGFSDVLLIEKSGTNTIRIEQASAIHPLTGADLTGDGIPEAMIETYSGGAHCCFGLKVYRLGTNPQLILDKPESNAGGHFDDLNSDKVLEYITADDLFAYQYCSYAASPFAKVILQYDLITDQYIPASPLFPEMYTEDILHHTEIAETSQPGDLGEWDDSSKCSILPLLLDYIYMGDLETARAELARLYPYADAEDFWNEIMLYVQDSSLYVAKEAE